MNRFLWHPRWLQQFELSGIATQIAESTEDAKGNDSSPAEKPLVSVLAALERSSAEVRKSTHDALTKSDLLTRIKEKHDQAEEALNNALNVSLRAAVVARAEENSEVPKETEAMTTVSPGQDFLVAVDFSNGSKSPLFIDGLKLEVPEGWGTTSDKTKRVAIRPGDNVHVVFRLSAPKNAAYTRPYWHRDDPETESVNHIDNETYVTLPFPPPLLRARLQYSSAGIRGVQAKSEIGATVVAKFKD